MFERQKLKELFVSSTSATWPVLALTAVQALVKKKLQRQPSFSHSPRAVSFCGEQLSDLSSISMFSFLISM